MCWRGEIAKCSNCVGTTPRANGGTLRRGGPGRKRKSLRRLQVEAKHNLARALKLARQIMANAEPRPQDRLDAMEFVRALQRHRQADGQGDEALDVEGGHRFCGRDDRHVGQPAAKAQALRQRRPGSQPRNRIRLQRKGDLGVPVWEEASRDELLNAG